jgi:hypothetical protein
MIYKFIMQDSCSKSVAVSCSKRQHLCIGWCSMLQPELFTSSFTQVLRAHRIGWQNKPTVGATGGRILVGYIYLDFLRWNFRHPQVLWRLYYSLEVQEMHANPRRYFVWTGFFVDNFMTMCYYWLSARKNKWNWPPCSRTILWPCVITEIVSDTKKLASLL